MRTKEFSELTRLGIEFYEKHLKSKLEPEHSGEFIAIEPYLERYFIDKDEMQVILKARQELPDKLFYFARVGYKYAHKIGGRCLKVKPSGMKL
ncbi:MAG TPA: hypothetical protein VGB00_07095 [Pyrinomonadaceae bacterium]|jgi:hypothetical protein